MKPSLSAHVKEKRGPWKWGKESVFNKTIYSPWAERLDLGSNN